MRRLEVEHRDLEVGLPGDPIGFVRLLVLDSTIVGYSGPIVGSSLVALEEVRHRVLEVLGVVGLDHMDMVAAHNLVVDNPGVEEGSLEVDSLAEVDSLGVGNPEEDIVVVVEDILGLEADTVGAEEHHLEAHQEAAMQRHVVVDQVVGGLQMEVLGCRKNQKLLVLL